MSYDSLVRRRIDVNPEMICKLIEWKELLAHAVGEIWKLKASQVDEWVQADKVVQKDIEEKVEG